MATMFEKGQSKRYSRVSYGMSGGGEAKRRSKDDDKSEAAEANPYGSTKALNEATKNMRRGGMAESKKMMRKEVAFMKKKKAPKSMIAHEKAEMKGEKTKKYAFGGALKRKIQENMAKGRAVAARPTNSRPASRPKARPMPRPTANRPKSRPMPNPRPTNPRPTTGRVVGRNGSGVVATPRPTNSRPTANRPKNRPMPRPTNSRPTPRPKNRPMPRPTANRPAPNRPAPNRPMPNRPRMKTGGKVKGYYRGGSVDGCVTKGRTKGKIK